VHFLTGLALELLELDDNPIVGAAMSDRGAVGTIEVAPNGEEPLELEELDDGLSVEADVVVAITGFSSIQNASGETIHWPKVTATHALMKHNFFISSLFDLLCKAIAIPLQIWN